MKTTLALCILLAIAVVFVYEAEARYPLKYPVKYPTAKKYPTKYPTKYPVHKKTPVVYKKDDDDCHGYDCKKKGAFAYTSGSVYATSGEKKVYHDKDYDKYDSGDKYYPKPKSVKPCVKGFNCP